MKVLGSKSAALVLVLAGLGLACSACEEKFRPETLVDRLRILGIRAEPPSLGLTDEALIDALVVDPTGDGRPIDYTWAVCLIQLDDFASDLPCPGPDAYPLPGAGPATTLSMPELVAWAIEQGFELEPQTPDPSGEVPAEVPLLLGLLVEAGQESIRAVKRVKLRLTEDAQPNTNPRLTGLEVDGQAFEQPQVQLQLGQEVELRPLVDEASRDWFVLQGQSEPRQEDVLFSWFSTGGEFSDQRTVLDVSRAGQPLEVNRWRLPELAEQAGPHSLWLVVRDGRYGIDWLRFGFELMP